MNYLASVKVQKYKDLPETGKTELAKKFVARFGKAKDRFHRLIAAKEHAPTVDEREWLNENIDRYWDNYFKPAESDLATAPAEQQTTTV